MLSKPIAHAPEFMTPQVQYDPAKQCSIAEYRRVHVIYELLVKDGDDAEKEVNAPAQRNMHVFLRNNDPGPTVFPPHSWRRLVATTTITEEYDNDEASNEHTASVKPNCSEKVLVARTNHLVAALPITVTHAPNAIPALCDNNANFDSPTLSDDTMQPPALEDAPMKRKTPSSDLTSVRVASVPLKKKKRLHVREDNPHGFNPTQFALLLAMSEQERQQTIEKWLRIRESWRRHYYRKKARAEGRVDGDV